MIRSPTKEWIISLTSNYFNRGVVVLREDSLSQHVVGLDLSPAMDKALLCPCFFILKVDGMVYLMGLLWKLMRDDCCVKPLSTKILVAFT